jgi:hypothetical protein
MPMVSYCLNYRVAKCLTFPNCSAIFSEIKELCAGGVPACAKAPDWAGTNYEDSKNYGHETRNTKHETRNTYIRMEAYE